MVRLVHLELSEANAFVKRHHRHHGRIPWHRFSLGAMHDDQLVGVAVIGRPLGGKCQDRWVEITRLCTDGTPNTASFLLGAAARAAFALGFTRIQTFILKNESGVSLRAAGWKFERMSHPSGWHRRGRPLPQSLQGRKQLWFTGEASPIQTPNGARLRPWERLGMSRSTWYRLGNPKRPAERLTQKHLAAAAGVSVRTIQRQARAAPSRLPIRVEGVRASVR